MHLYNLLGLFKLLAGISWDWLIVVLTDSAAIEETAPDEALLIKQSSVLSTEDRDLLARYHHGFDDEKVDIDLITCLLFAIHSQPREGLCLHFHFSIQVAQNTTAGVFLVLCFFIWMCLIFIHYIFIFILFCIIL